MIINLPDIHEVHQHFAEANRRMFQGVLTRAGNAAMTEVGTYNYGFKRRTGAIARLTRRRVFDRPSGGLLRLESRAPHARILEEGSLPHVIRARRKKALRFMAGGQVVFRQAVVHPGTKAYRFLSQAQSLAFEVAGQHLARGMQQLARLF